MSGFVPEANQQGYTVYSKRDCVWCDRVKALLERETQEEVHVVSCDDALAANREEFIQIMRGRTQLETIKFPLVFHNATFVGGYMATKSYIDSTQ